MSVRVALAAMLLIAAGVSGDVARGDEGANANSALEQVSETSYTIEERALADLAAGMNAFVLSSTQNSTQIQFNLPPNVDTDQAWLKLAARPASTMTDGRIHVSVNGGEAITIRPQPRAMEARFALFSGDFQPGENTLSISYSSETASDGWIVDARRSQLRLALDLLAPVDSLDALETNLASDFASPLRVALVTDISRQRVAIESLVAQGIALRAGSVPLFTTDESRADLVIRIAENGRLEDADREALHNGRMSLGPEIAFIPGVQPRLIITGRNIDEATAASRLFAARSLAGYERNFIASDAVSANILGQRQISDANHFSNSDNDLRTFATSGLPFSADQGSRTAVQISSIGDEDRTGALSLLARAALVSGEAWLYAWYGSDQDTVPANHNLLVIGPSSGLIDTVNHSAPAEMRAALRAAERSRGQRGLMRLAAAAYASDAEDDTQLVNLGVASLFANQEEPGRWIAALTAPDLASLETAGRSLARSDLWGALEGRAAVWSERGVTPFDYSVTAPTWSELAREFAMDHTRDAAFLLFGFAFFILIRGILNRRRVHAS